MEPKPTNDNEEHEPDEKESLYDRFLHKWWGKVAVGSLALFAGYGSYCDFTKLENGEVDSIWGAKLSIQLYEIAGKWPPVCLFVLLGLFVFGWGVKQLSTGKE